MIHPMHFARDAVISRPIASISIWTRASA
jgi:hypothetical protein